MSHTRASFGFLAAAVVGLGTMTPASAGLTTEPHLQQPHPSTEISQQAEVLSVADANYIVMLELPSAAKRGPNAMASAQGKAAVAAATQKQADKWSAKGVKVKQRYEALGGFSAHLTPAQVEALRNDPAVSTVTENKMISIDATQYSAPWGLDRVDQDDLPLNGTYNYTETGQGVTSYVLDTGILANHSDLGGRVQAGVTAIDDGRGSADCNGHGTHVAGTVGGTRYGVAKGTTLVPVRVLGCDGRGSTNGIISAMDWVAQNKSGPSVANMSLGGGADAATDQGIARMTSAGVITVVAAGNDTANACNYSPARASSAITVGSTDKTDGLSYFSNYGSCVDILAPGSDITSAWHTSSSATNTISGTSMASPHVAGAAALYLQKNPNASVSQVTNALTSTATTNTITGVKGSPNRMLNTIALTGGGSTPTPDPDPAPGQAVTNGGFESGSTGWNGDTWTINSDSYAAASGSNNLWLVGYGNSRTEQVQQRLTIPSGASSLDFKLRVDSAENTSYSRYDTLQVRLLDSSGYVLKTLGSYSNLDESSSYRAKSLDLSAYAGRTVTLQFTATEDYSAQTSFLIDDVAIR